jgi:hypothetical protein
MSILNMVDVETYLNLINNVIFLMYKFSYLLEDYHVGQGRFR